ncbi:SgrR family transcriptional regulator [Vibrio genomosp. F10 str. 9ZC157]|uniref:Transcriptional regulator n=1 Tax=Vibrio genomosp. F10 str. ZF-129 TaxID=1187848 RepID=A0A1E5BBL0_9VIBR|nr:SgrR family transcriptional regulator [Vibrio genomosp. F10]OEE31416.1 transcriptional regulator [Vibrio genomosp. F10 str. ZF-129]OEE93629.1 transcriptional regulator [Vibrio genomosp. F10 str. 9ZC157]
MSSPRLRVQFETLFTHFKGQDSGIQLDEITEILFCTRRNARIVLNKMEEEGWIEWKPAPGRGKLSQLNFKRSRSDVNETLAKQYLDEGRISHALSVLGNDSAKLARVIDGYLGVQHQEGQQVIRLPYYRPLSMLNTNKNMRRSEQHIAQQIFSGLTRLDDADNLQPDLAHSWEALSNRVWRFYIRPRVRFHTGVALETNHIIESLLLLKSTPLFSHIEQVTSPSESIIDVTLSADDKRLPLLLAESCAKVLLPDHLRNDNFDIMPIGTGPYRVAENNDKRLVLQAFDGYFGFRPLIDRVEVWVIDEVHSSMIFPSLSNPIKPDINNHNEEVKLDPGCTYLLLNRRDGLASSNQWAEYFTHKLHTMNLFRMLPDKTLLELGVLPAHGLKPGWYHQSRSNCAVTAPAETTVTIAYHAQHPMFPTLAKTIEKILREDGLKVHMIKYDVDVPNAEEIDIWVKPMGIANNRDDALVGWLLDYSDIQKMSTDEHFKNWTHLVDAWRADDSLPFPGRALGQSLAEHLQLIPLFHCWLGVSQDQCGSLQNVKCNALGWFDFSRAWVKPSINGDMPS